MLVAPTKMLMLAQQASNNDMQDVRYFPILFGSHSEDERERESYLGEAWPAVPATRCPASFGNICRQDSGLHIVA